MKIFLVLSLLAVSATAAGAQPTVSQLSWLAGCWKAPDAEQGSGEQWTPPAGGAMLGMSRTLRQGTMIEFEYMQIRALDDGTLAFIAQPSGRPPTTFQLKALDDSGVIFENLTHDFPQRVVYTREGNDRLEARIEGINKGKPRSISFPMVRIDCTEHFSPARG